MNNPSPSGLELRGDISTFQDIVRLLHDRDEKFEDIDYIRSRGGEDWLINTLVTHPLNGIQENTILQRETKFGSNRKKREDPPCM